MTRKQSHFSIFTALLLAASAGHAGINAWTLTGPEGGAVTAVAVHPTDASVVLASAGNGMYRSADGGVSWARTGAASVAVDILFDPANAARIFVVSDTSRMYRSEDAGLTFSTLTAPANSAPHRLGISGNSILYMADRAARFYRSADLGVTWTEVSHGWNLAEDAVTAIAVDRGNANVLYAGVKGVGTYKSIDGGANWSAPPANSPGSASAQTEVYQLVIKPDDPSRILGAALDGVYVSANAGLTWTQSNAVIPRAFAFDPAANNNVVAMSLQGQVSRSNDGGLTWPVGLRGANLGVGQAMRLAFAPPDKVIAATIDGPMVSTDGGATFTRNAGGMHAESVNSFATAEGVNYASFLQGPFGVFRREGAGWLPVDNEELRSRLLSPFVRSVTVAPANPNRLFVVGGPSQLVSSSDGGQSWSAPHAQFNTGSPYLVKAVIDPTDQQIVYLLTQGAGLFKSEDGGVTFTPRTTGLPASINSLTIDRTNHQVLYAGGFFSGSTGVFKSTDGGMSWQPTAALPDRAVEDIVIDPVNSSVVYALLGTNIYKSSNGGSTWMHVTWDGTLSMFGVRGMFFDRVLPTTMYLAGTPTSPGLSRSIDAGATWQHVAWAPAFPSIGTLDVMAADGIFAGSFFAGGIGTGLHQYQIANDLRLNFTSPLSFALGATGTLQIPVQNVGPFHAASPELHFNIPSNITVTVPAGCRYISPSMVCTLPNIRVGETYSFALPYSASATPANLAMGVYLFGREVELTPNDTQFGIAVNVLAMADVGVSATGTASVQQNAALTYTATITNSGPNASAVTTLNVQVPAGVSIQTRTPSAGTCTAVNATTTCELGALASGASASVTLVGTALTVGAQAWSSTVTTGAQDSVATNNTAPFTTNVTAPPPPPSGGGSSGGGGGGGRFDWLAALLLGALALSRGWTRVSAHR